MSPVTETEPLSFQNIGCGAAEEKFNAELARVLANIQDPNTSWKAKRKIVMEITFEPRAEDRIDINILIDVKAKLTADKPFLSRIFVGRTIGGRPEAHEINANQGKLFPKTKDNVASIGAGKE